MCAGFNNYVSIYSAIERPEMRNMTVTFDDGLLDVYTHAYPILKQYKIPFTIFITTSLIGQDGYLNLQQIKELSNDPLVTIGSHCVHHKPLKGLTYDNQKIELIQSHSELEKIIGKGVDLIAYPYGQYDKNTLEILEKNKIYKYGFVAEKGPINLQNKNPHLLPRVGIDNRIAKERAI